MTERKTVADLRSRRWFSAGDMRAFAHRQRAQQMGLRREDVLGKPCIAVVNTWSDLSPCHGHLRERAEAVKRGILMAGGTPFELPALMTRIAANPKFFQHRGRALVFDNPAEMNQACADLNLDCDENSVLVLRNAGPVGAPGMPEWGGLPIPKKLLAQGVRDMVRISDARMSRWAAPKANTAVRSMEVA